MKQITPFGTFARVGRWLSSLRTQLILGNVVALAILLGVLGIVCRYVIFSFMLNSIDRDLERSAMRMRRPPPFQGEMRGGRIEGKANDRMNDGREEPPGNETPPPAPEPRKEGFGGYDHAPNENRPPRPPDANNPYRPRLFTLEGKAFFPYETYTLWDKNTYLRSLKGEAVYSTIRGDQVDEEPLRVISVPVQEDNRLSKIVQVAYPLKEVYRAISGVNTALMLLIPVGLLGVGWAGSALTNRVLKRVQRMTQAAALIGAKDFSQRLPVLGNDEFSELSTTFNGLLGRLEGAYTQQETLLEQQRRFTADASHELKTPLTIIKGTTSLTLNSPANETLYRNSLEEIDLAANTMSQLVQDLLLLARSDEGQLGKDRIEVLIREILETALSRVSVKGGARRELSIEDETLSVVGNETELVRLFLNLLENAVHYTPENGEVRVKAKERDGQVVVTIADTGVGIAPEHLSHLGERFYRVDSSRSRPTGGTGLGLSICKSLVKAQGGTLHFESELGIGTTVTVTLPSA